jgi:uncharacterized protein (TIGR02466 family)
MSGRLGATGLPGQHMHAAGLLERLKFKEIFPVPVCEGVIPQFAAENDAILALIMDERQADAGVRRSAVGAWQSGGNIFARTQRSPALDTLRSLLVLAAEEYLKNTLRSKTLPTLDFDIVGWANVCMAGHFHRAHTHPGATLSGVYYVSAGSYDSEHPASGILELLDTRCAMTPTSVAFKLAGQAELILPRTCGFVIFPSSLLHTVNAYFGKEPRVSIGFNLSVVPQVQPHSSDS